MVEAVVPQCLPSQAATYKTVESKEPLKMSKLPDFPWRMVSIDFTGPFKSGEYLLVIIDNYSHFPKVEIVGSTSL